MGGRNAPSRKRGGRLVFFFFFCGFIEEEGARGALQPAGSKGPRTLMAAGDLRRIFKAETGCGHAALIGRFFLVFFGKARCGSNSARYTGTG